MSPCHDSWHRTDQIRHATVDGESGLLEVRTPVMSWLRWRFFGSRGRIVEVSRYPSLKWYRGLSPEWPRRDSFCSAEVVDIHFVWSMSGVLLVLVWFCFQRCAYPVGVLRLTGPPTSLDSFGVSFCAFKQKQMNSYHEDTASIRSCCSRLPWVWGKDGNDEGEGYARQLGRIWWEEGDWPGMDMLNVRTMRYSDIPLFVMREI